MSRIMLDQIETKLATTENRAAHVIALLAAMGGSPAGWEYTGEVIDSGKDQTEKCACGHPIRYIFPIEKTTAGKTDTVNIGSTCINHVLTLDPLLGKALQRASDRLQEQLKEAQKKAKKAAEEAKVNTIRARFEAMHAEMIELYRSYERRGYRAPRKLWEAAASDRYYIQRTPPRYQTSKPYIQWYEKQIRAVEYAVRKEDGTW